MVFDTIRKLVETLHFINSLDLNRDFENSVKRINGYIEANPTWCKKIGFDKSYELIKYMSYNILERGVVFGANKTLDRILGEEGSFNIIGAENVPAEGPAIYVSNHPWGIVDGLGLLGGLGGILEEKQKDFKIAGIHLLRFVNGIEKSVLFVDMPHDASNGYNGENLGPGKKLISHLKGGGHLALYPSGETYRGAFRLKDPKWKDSLGKNFWKYADNVVPMYFNGPKHGWQHRVLAFPLWHQLRRVAIFKEAWNKKGKHIVLSIGKPISKERLNEFGKDYSGRTKYIRKKCEELSL